MLGACLSPLLICFVGSVPIRPLRGSLIYSSDSDDILHRDYIFLFVKIYFMARLLLLVQVIVSLRALPPSAFQAVQWTSFIPHI